MTRSSDLVMVEREVLERAHGHLCKIAGTETWTHNNLDGWQVTPGALREYAESAAKELDRALQSVEGGVQGSIATKQESCPESAPRTETATVTALRECQRVLAMMVDPASIKSTSVIGNLRAALGQLLQCPALADENHSDPSWGCAETAQAISAARAALSAPNHQPHAVSQGWRLVPIEPTVVQSNAGVDADDMRTGFETIKHIYRAMVAAAPPSPENTPRESSESTTGGAE